MSDVSVVDNPEKNRFEAYLDDELAGFAQYQLAKELIVFTHTEVDDAYEGKGVGSALVRGALDAVRGTRLRVLPLCPFVKRWIGKHDEYADLVYGAPESRVKD